jgi:hypothetical protein
VLRAKRLRHLISPRPREYVRPLAAATEMPLVAQKTSDHVLVQIHSEYRAIIDAAPVDADYPNVALRLSAHHKPDLERVFDRRGRIARRYSERRGIGERIKAIGSEGKRIVIISTLNGDSNTYFYREFADRQVGIRAIRVMAFSIGDRELLGADTSPSGIWRLGITSSLSSHPRTKLL